MCIESLFKGLSDILPTYLFESEAREAYAGPCHPLEVRLKFPRRVHSLVKHVEKERSKASSLVNDLRLISAMTN